MYSADWFKTFVESIPSPTIDSEVAALASLIPLPQYRLVLDVGCGTGRAVTPLVARGYEVIGIDLNADALRVARRAAPAATVIALDQRHATALRARLDAVLLLWNSLGYDSKQDDELTLSVLHSVLRPGGRLLLDLYNPAWLETHELDQHHYARGATVTRWLQNGRACHRIVYANGSVDHIDFNIYAPDEIIELVRSLGFSVEPPLVWWRTASVTPRDARYQIAATRTEPGGYSMSPGE